MNNSSFISYPDIQDTDFYQKIYEKKEFRDIKIKEKDNIIKKEFILSENQIFLKNYISPDTFYNGIMIISETGTGKTCSAISIAEGFKKTLKNINKKILILTTLKKNFINTLYDFRKEKDKKNPEDIVQCTGKAYDLGEESLYLTFEQKKKEIYKIINSYYQFFGYRGFANHVINNTGNWKGDEKDINEKIKKWISKEFDNRVIIIDEIQNIKTDKKFEYSKSIQPILEMIVKYGKNIKLILMSATPMFDRPDEIIFYINLLLLNDRRKIINKNDIFNSKDGSLKEGAEDKLRNIFKGYFSYIRGEKPFIFPFRIYPKESEIPNYNYYMNGNKIEDNKKIKFTKIILCEMSDIQNNTYNYYFNKKKAENLIINNQNILNNISNEEIENINEKNDMRLLLDLTKISNIVYPIINTSNIGSFYKNSLESEIDNGNGGYYRSIKTIGTKKKIQYKYQSHAIFNKNVPFADQKYISKYSIKFAKILETIKKSKGLILIFSQFIEQGALPLALMLEQNGFDRACSEGEDQLLDFPYAKEGGKRRQICYLCGKEFNSNNDHYNEKSINYHIPKIAKYILCFGESKDIIKVKKEEALAKFCSDKNKNGEEIKIMIGTKVISEGLDFKRLRQVHILEPWYNLSRHEQIIGRAIRYYSHIDLPEEEQNVEIYQYASILNKLNKSNKDKLFLRESIDLKNYRIAENKDIIIKNIMRIMKESAVDCILLKKENIIDSNKKVRQITSSGEILNISLQDKPFTSRCDYKEKCKYLCNWEPKPGVKYPINTDTYNLRFASTDIENIKKDIKNMFRENIVYYLENIEKYILDKYKNIDKLFIYSALENLVNNKNEIIYDKFSRKGYIIYRGDYYVFQPFDLERDEIPYIYRTYPSNIKPDYVDLENIDLDYSENEINNKKELNEDLFIENIIKNIQLKYNLHIGILENYDKKEYENKYLDSIISTIVDSLDLEEEFIFIKNILIQYLNKSKEIYIENIIHYLNKKNILINYYSEIEFDKSKIKNNFFVGFITNNTYYIIESILKKDTKLNTKLNTKLKEDINFIICPKEYVLKIKSYKNIKKNINKKIIDNEYNLIYGIIEFDKIKKNKKFKIIDKSSEDIIYTKEKKKSKRSVIKGRICTTFQVNQLLELREKIGLYRLNGKRRTDFICEELEIYFRFNNLINKDGKIWLEEV